MEFFWYLCYLYGQFICVGFGLCVCHWVKYWCFSRWISFIVQHPHNHTGICPITSSCSDYMNLIDIRLMIDSEWMYLGGSCHVRNHTRTCTRGYSPVRWVLCLRDWWCSQSMFAPYEGLVCIRLKVGGFMLFSGLYPSSVPLIVGTF